MYFSHFHAKCFEKMTRAAGLISETYKLFRGEDFFSCCNFWWVFYELMNQVFSMKIDATSSYQILLITLKLCLCQSVCLLLVPGKFNECFNTLKIRPKPKKSKSHLRLLRIFSEFRETTGEEKLLSLVFIFSGFCWVFHCIAFSVLTFERMLAEHTCGCICYMVS